MRGNKLTSFDAYLEPPEPNDTPSYECDFCNGRGELVDKDTGDFYDCEGCGGSGLIEMGECNFCDSFFCHCDEDYDTWRDQQ